jgi:hypothetical protein
MKAMAGIWSSVALPAIVDEGFDVTKWNATQGMARRLLHTIRV